MDAARRKELFAQVAAIFDERIPFNRVLGLHVDRLDDEGVAVGFRMRPELVGNFVVGALHGGVISAVLDTTGGLAALAGIIRGSRHAAGEDLLSRFARIGTIDLRIDYLRPGLGAHFLARAHPLRAGRRVTVTRMELASDTGTLVAVGTGTYIVS